MYQPSVLARENQRAKDATRSTSATVSRILQNHEKSVPPRTAWMIYYEQVRNVRKVCLKFGISRKTFYKWLARYQASGYRTESLQDQSRRPHHSPNATSKEIVKTVLQAKQKTGFGQRRLKLYLEKHYKIHLSEHTIWKILRKLHDHDSPAGHQTQSPGDLVQMSARDITQYINHKPWVQYTAIDVVTRLRITRIYERHSAQSASDFLTYVIERFPFPIKEIQTPDHKAFTNGNPTMGVASVLFKPFRVVLAHHSIRHTVLPEADLEKSHPAWSERLDTEEFYSQHNYRSADEIKKALDQFTEHYNNHRTCEQLKGLTPLQKLRTFPDYKPIAYFEVSQDEEEFVNG